MRNGLSSTAAAPSRSASSWRARSPNAVITTTRDRPLRPPEPGEEVEAVEPRHAHVGHDRVRDPVLDPEGAELLDEVGAVRRLTTTS